jgi:hypothetical protein
MGKTKDLSKDCKNIVLNLFKIFQNHQEFFFRSFDLLDSGGLLPFTTLYTEL